MKVVRNTFFCTLVSTGLLACGESGDSPNTATGSNPPYSLDGQWTHTQCEINTDDPTDSIQGELVFRGNQITQSENRFFNNTNCSGAETLTAAVNGTYFVSGNTTTLADGEARHIDIQFSTGSYSVSQAHADKLAAAGTSLENVLLAQGIDRADNLPASQIFANPNFYTVFRQQGNTLSIGTDIDASNNSPDTRLAVLNETYNRADGNSTTNIPQTTINTDIRALNANIPNANRPDSAVSLIVDVLTTSPPYVSFEGRMMMTFPNGYSSYCMDWDIVTESPTPNSIGDQCELTREPQNDTPLHPFQPGETINIAFGSLEASGFQVPGTISTSGITEGDLLLNEAGEIVISSTRLTSTTGTASTVTTTGERETRGHYYLNGYTITIKLLDGSVYHSYIGILGRESGRVTSLFLGNKFYSENL